MHSAASRPTADADKSKCDGSPKWTLFLALLVLLVAGEIVVLTGSRGGGDETSRPPLANGGLALIQHALQAPAVGAALPALAVGAAFLLGALHALAPGHNKILTGAYLVGLGGRVSHAVLIGAATAFSHTASVLAIGLLRLADPGEVIASFYGRWLALPVGLIVTGLGVWLLLRRMRADAAEHSQDDHHEHGHDRTHPLPPASGRLTLGTLVGLGLMHGLVPTPDAVAVLAAALSVKQALLGLALILAYSLGIAGVLSAVGALFLTSRDLAARFSRLEPLTRWAPVGAAVIVIILGVSATLRALSA